MRAFDEWILPSFAFSSIADVLSVVGFFVTVWVLVDVKRIKRDYLFKARIPELAVALGTCATRISASLSSLPISAHHAALELAETEVVLKSIRKKTGGELRASAKRVLKLTGNVRRRPDEENLRLVYVEVRKLESEVAETLKDLQWEN